MFKGQDTGINLHTFSPSYPEIERMLFFRDWLRSNASDRRLYERTGNLTERSNPFDDKVDPFVKTGGRAVVRATLLLFLSSSSLC